MEEKTKKEIGEKRSTYIIYIESRYIIRTRPETPSSGKFEIENPCGFCTINICGRRARSNTGTKVHLILYIYYIFF